MSSPHTAGRTYEGHILYVLFGVLRIVGMKIETERLFIYPVSDEEMKALIDNTQDAELKQAYSEMLAGCTDHPENRVWYAAWYMELKGSGGTVIGDLCFKGIDHGTVEVGYGLRQGRCGHGYMTEAVRAISGWALSQKGITRVEAETAPDNIPSRKVLINSGYIPTGENGAEGPRFVYTGKVTA